VYLFSIAQFFTQENNFENPPTTEVFREQGYEDVSATATSVNLEKDTPIAILDDLAEGDNCFYSLEVKDSIIKNKNEEIKLEKDKSLNKDLALASKQIETEKLDKALDTSLQLNKKTEKQLKAQKVLKWVYAGVGLGLGILITR
jgi:hypothetical protein